MEAKNRKLDEPKELALGFWGFVSYVLNYLQVVLKCRQRLCGKRLQRRRFPVRGIVFKCRDRVLMGRQLGVHIGGVKTFLRREEA